MRSPHPTRGGGFPLHAEGAGIHDTSLRWPGGQIHFFLEDTGSAALTTSADPQNPGERENFLRATAYIQARVRVQFIELTRAQFDIWSGDAIHVQNVPGANKGDSKVGRVGGIQVLELGDQGAGGGNGPLGENTIRHELGHAMGLRHEVQRPDRDQYLTVCTANTTDASQYDIENDVDLLSPYDFHSIMHYGYTGFRVSNPDPAQCGGNTMALNPVVNTFPNAVDACVQFGLDVCHNVGQTITLSNGIVYNGYTASDVNTLALMYGWPLAQNSPNDLFGTSLAVADFDQDGFADVVSGAAGAAAGNGQVFAYKGTYRGLTPWKTLPTSSGGGQGHAMAAADLNGDGFPDVAVGAPGGAGIGQNSSGIVTVYLGGRLPDALLTPDCPTNALCQGTGTAPFGSPAVNGESMLVLKPSDAPGVTNDQGAMFGAAIATADFDGDKVADLVISAPGMAGGAGRVFVYSGARLKAGQPRSIMLGQAAKGGFGSFGTALATGDLNGDGRPDLAVGAAGSGAGHVAIFQTVSVTSFLDKGIVSPPIAMSGQQFGAAVLIAPLSGAKGPQNLIVGAPFFRTGQVLVYRGNAAMAFTTPAQTVTPASDLAGAFGSSLATVDFDNNTLADVVIGAPQHAPAGAAGVFKSNGASLTAWNTIAAPSPLTVGFGSALAIGSVFEDPGATLQLLYPGLRATIFVGGPSAFGPSPFLAPKEGRVNGYGVTTTNVLTLDDLGPELRSAYAAAN